MKTLALLLAAAALTGCSRAPQAQEPDVLEQIRECSRIYTSEFQITKIIVDRSNDKRIIALPVRAVAKSYVDLGDLTAADVSINGRNIDVTMPEPRVEITATRIPADGICSRVALFRRDFSDSELTRLQQQGRDSLRAELPGLGLEDAARRSAALTLTHMLTNLNFRQIKITAKSAK